MDTEDPLVAHNKIVSSYMCNCLIAHILKIKQICLLHYQDTVYFFCFEKFISMICISFLTKWIEINLCKIIKPLFWAIEKICQIFNLTGVLYLQNVLKLN